MSYQYYLYVSDSKVDMLLAQMDPAFTRKRTTEVSLNLNLFGGKRATETPAGGERTAKLQRVVRYLEEHGDLGTVDEPGQFFWGLLPMSWGPFPAEPTLVCFGGNTGRTVVGLGGSGHHILWHLPSGELVTEVECSQDVIDVELSADACAAAAILGHHDVQCWELDWDYRA